MRVFKGILGVVIIFTVIYLSILTLRLEEEGVITPPYIENIYIDTLVGLLLILAVLGVLWVAVNWLSKWVFED